MSVMNNKQIRNITCNKEGGEGGMMRKGSSRDTNFFSYCSRLISITATTLPPKADGVPKKPKQQCVVPLGFADGCFSHSGAGISSPNGEVPKDRRIGSTVYCMNISLRSSEVTWTHIW